MFSLLRALQILSLSLVSSELSLVPMLLGSGILNSFAALSLSSESLMLLSALCVDSAMFFFL